MFGFSEKSKNSPATKVEGDPEMLEMFRDRVKKLHPEARPEDVTMTANALAVSYAEGGNVPDKIIEDTYVQRLIARPDGPIKGVIDQTDGSVEVR